LVVNARAANCLKNSSLKWLLCVEWVLNSACAFIHCYCWLISLRLLWLLLNLHPLWVDHCHMFPWI